MSRWMLTTKLASPPVPGSKHTAYAMKLMDGQVLCVIPHVLRVKEDLGEWSDNLGSMRKWTKSWINRNFLNLSRWHTEPASILPPLLGKVTGSCLEAKGSGYRFTESYHSVQPPIYTHRYTNTRTHPALQGSHTMGGTWESRLDWTSYCPQICSLCSPPAWSGMVESPALTQLISFCAFSKLLEAWINEGIKFIYDGIPYASTWITINSKRRWDGMGCGREKATLWEGNQGQRPSGYHSCCANHTSFQNTYLSCFLVSCFHPAPWPGLTLWTIQSQVSPASSWTHICFSECYFFSKPSGLGEPSCKMNNPSTPFYFTFRSPSGWWRKRGFMVGQTGKKRQEQA